MSLRMRTHPNSIRDLAQRARADSPLPVASSGAQECCPENVREQITHVGHSFRARRAGVQAKRLQGELPCTWARSGGNLFPLPTRYLNFEVKVFVRSLRSGFTSGTDASK